MALVDKAQQTINALVLKNEVAPEGNTRDRVYQLLKDLIDSSISYTDVKQVTGLSPTDIMSQKAVTDAISIISKNLSQVLTAGNDAGGIRIVNLADPVSPQDADTQSARDLAITTAVTQAIINLIDSAPSDQDTLKKLADAIALKAPLLSPALTGIPTAPTPLAGDSSTTIATTDFVQQAAASVNRSLAQVLAIGADANSIEITNLANGTSNQSAATVSQVNAAKAAAQAYADGLLVSVFRFRGVWNPNVGSVYPDANGTGAGGSIMEGNAFEIEFTGGGFDAGDIVIAKIDNPGQTPGNWGTSEHNTQQATSTERGTALIVDTATIQNAATTDDQKIVTALKFWQGVSTLKLAQNTWADVQTFTSAPKFNSIGASSYLKVDGLKSLTSVSSIPSADITYAVQNANLVFAGPTSGGAVAPTFRALVTADLAASIVTYAKIQNVTDGRLLGNASGGVAAPSEISVSNGLTLAASTFKLGGVLTGLTTLTSNGASQLGFDGAWTASANNQYQTQFSSTITSRPTANDGISGYVFKPTFNINTTNVDANGVVIDASYNMAAGISTIVQTGTTSSGMTPGTYTNVPLSSTSGTGTGALFTVVVTNSSGFGSYTPTTPGTGYKLGDTWIINASAFGGTGASNGVVSALTTQTLNTKAAPLTIYNRIPTGGYYDRRFLDFRNAAGTSIGGFAYNFQGGADVFTMYDAVGAMLSSTGVIISTARGLAVSGSTFLSNFSVSGTTTFSNAITMQSGALVSNATSLYNNSSGSSGIFKVTSNTGQNGNNAITASFLSSGTNLVGFITTLGAITPGSGYTNGTFPNTPLSGGSGSGASANITITGGSVTACTLIQRGSGYRVGEVLSASSTGMGAGVGFSIPVATTDNTGTANVGFHYNNVITDPSSFSNYIGFYGTPTINQTSLASGYVAALYWNPTLTSIVGNNYGIIITPASARNGFGTSSPTATMHVVSQASAIVPTLKLVGTGTGTNKALSVLQSDASTSILSLSDNGDFTLGLSGSKLGFYGVSAVAKPTTSIAAASFLANTSNVNNDTATWGGYTIGQIITALKQIGLLT